VTSVSVGHDNGNISSSAKQINSLRRLYIYYILRVHAPKEKKHVHTTV